MKCLCDGGIKRKQTNLWHDIVIATIVVLIVIATLTMLVVSVSVTAVVARVYLCLPVSQVTQQIYFFLLSFPLALHKNLCVSVRVCVCVYILQLCLHCVIKCFKKVNSFKFQSKNRNCQQYC